MGLLSDRINNKLERTNLIIEHAFNRESVPLSASEVIRGRGKLCMYNNESYTKGIKKNTID